MPFTDATDVIMKLVTICQKEEMMLARILSGQLIHEWVDAALASKGYEIIEHKPVKP